MTDFKEAKAPLLGEVQHAPQTRDTTTAQARRRLRAFALLALCVPLAVLWLSGSTPSWPKWDLSLARIRRPCHGFFSPPHHPHHPLRITFSSGGDLFKGVRGRLEGASTAGLGDIAHRLESLFLSIPSPESAKETLRGYTTE